MNKRMSEGEAEPIWEHEPTRDAQHRVQKAFEMLLADALDDLTEARKAGYCESIGSEEPS